MNKSRIFELFSGIKTLSFSSLVSSLNYFPFFYAIHCIYVCFFLRKMTPIGGLTCFRSYFLGLSLSYGTRYTFSTLLSLKISKEEKKQIFSIFSVVWLLLNIFRFDFIYKMLKMFVFRLFIQIIASYGQSVLLVNCMFNISNVFPGNIPRSLLSIVTSFSVPCFIDFFDSMTFGMKYNPHYYKNRRFVMLYPFHYIKRVLFLAFIIQLFTEKQWILPDSYISSYSSLTTPISLISTFLTIFDLLSHEGKSFLMLDFIFPKIFRLFFTYYS